jgi:hypothetical protein
MIRLKAAPLGTKTQGHMCAWRGCQQAVEGEQLPKAWWWMVAYESPTPLLDWWKEKHWRKHRRDCVLCPQHAFMLNQMLKPLPKRIGEELDDSSH